MEATTRQTQADTNEESAETSESPYAPETTNESLTGEVVEVEADLTSETEILDETPEAKRDAATQATDNRGATADKRIQACVSESNVNGQMSPTNIHGTWIKPDDYAHKSAAWKGKMDIEHEEQSRYRNDKLFRMLRGFISMYSCIGNEIGQRAGVLLSEVRESSRHYPQTFTGEAVVIAVIETALDEFDHPFPRGTLADELAPANYAYDFSEKVTRAKEAIKFRNVHTRADEQDKAWVLELADEFDTPERYTETAIHALNYAEEMNDHENSSTYGGTKFSQALGAFLYAVKSHEGAEYSSAHQVNGSSVGDTVGASNSSVTQPERGYAAVLPEADAAEHVAEIAASHRDSDDFSQEAIEKAEQLAEVVQDNRRNQSNNRVTAAAVLYHVLDTRGEVDCCARTFGRHSSVNGSAVETQLNANNGETIPISEIVSE